MNTCKHSCSIRGATLALLLGSAAGATAATPDPTVLLDDMQHALVPSTAQLERVQITVREYGRNDETQSWNALVARERFADGPHTAVALVESGDLDQSALLTAPRDGGRQGLWIYAPSERRTREIAPLEADRRFLLTDFDFADLALTPAATGVTRVLDAENLGARATWKLETRPAEDDWKYSRVLTWIAADTSLPLRREYYDRAGRLWKIMTCRDALIDGIPTVLDITLQDVQSRTLSEWEVRAVSYRAQDIGAQALSDTALERLPGQPFWQALNDAYPAPRSILSAN